MKIMIVGAGELGQLLAARLCRENHDVTVLDASPDEFQHLQEKLDLMVIEGSASDISVLKSAGIENMHFMLAVSGDEASNIVACRLASHFGVKKTICRLYTGETFSEEDGVRPEMFGIWRAFHAPKECARKVMDAVLHRDILEKIQFSNPNAIMDVFSVRTSSPIAGLCIKNIPDISDIRFAALVRDSQFLVPHGDTIIIPGDKLYIAGSREHVDAFLNTVSGDLPPVKRVVIYGASRTGLLIAESLQKEKIEFRMIEKNLKRAEKFMDDLPTENLILHGDATESSVLEEAGIKDSDVFVAVDDDDEKNILACILAKKLGAKKVISVTHKPEYISMVPAMSVIDCGFNASLVSVNTVFRLMETGTCRIDAQLQRYHAYMTEFRITAKSRLCGRSMMDCKLPASAVFALIFRKDEVITPSGSTVLQAGDTIVAIMTPESAEELEPYFTK